MAVEAQHGRRQFLALLVKFLSMVALLAFAWVIFSSLTVNKQGGDKSEDYYVDVDLSQLKIGQLTKVTLRHKDIWVYHRSPQDIKQLKKHNESLRSVRDEYFVFFPYEPKRGCLVNWDQSNKTFYDTCNARHFDLAGRLVKPASSQPVQLGIPGYRFAADRLIQIDVRAANFR